MASNKRPKLPLCQLNTNIRDLSGNVDVYIQEIEDLKRTIDYQSRQTYADYPSFAFKINDLLSLVNAVSLKLSSYKRCCLDIAKFGADYEDKELQSLNGMLSFVQEMSSFSSLFEKRVDAIISGTDKAINSVTDLNNSSIRDSEPELGSRDCLSRVYRFVHTKLGITGQMMSQERNETGTWQQCEETLQKLNREAQHLKKSIKMFSENIEKSLVYMRSTSRNKDKDLFENILKVKASCTQLLD